MSGPVKRFALRRACNACCIDESCTGPLVHLSDYEAVVRERDEAQRKLADALQSVQSWQMEVAGRDSDIEQLRALLDALRIAVMEMHHDNVKGDFELPPLARIDLDACVAKCSDERIPRAGG